MSLESWDSLSPMSKDAALSANGSSTVRSVSPAVQTLERAMADIALTNMPVLLIGECGTGKKFLAQQIHRLSPRRNEALAKVICAATSGENFAGYFPPAGHGHDNHNGANESNGGNGHGNGAHADAAPGSLFLEEICELDGLSQRNLLYALPDSDAAPELHDRSPRLISSTSHNLEEEMRAGRFRNELYYRINGVSLRIPPLRQRREDIPVLVHFFLAKHSAQLGRQQPEVNARVMNLLQEYSWPGNIRELENAVKKIVVLGDPQIAVADLVTAAGFELRPAPAILRGSPLKAAARAASHQAERQLILEALARTRWNRKRAAQELQISYKSLLYKLKQIGADEPETA
jgi:DNA-binding NtrC family response regulator